MAIRIPAMPTDLVARDPTTQHSVQTGEPVRARTLGRAEDAVAHLAGGRPFPAPVTARHTALTDSYQTWRVRLATPLVPSLAVVHGTLRAQAPDIIDVRAQTDHDATWQTAAVAVSEGSAGDAIPFELQVEIGAGAIAAASGAFVEVTFEAKRRSASVTSHLMSIGVCPTGVEVVT